MGWALARPAPMTSSPVSFSSQVHWLLVPQKPVVDWVVMSSADVTVVASSAGFTVSAGVSVVSSAAGSTSSRVKMTGGSNSIKVPSEGSSMSVVLANAVAVPSIAATNAITNTDTILAFHFVIVPVLSYMTRIHANKMHKAPNPLLPYKGQAREQTKTQGKQSD